MAVCEHDAYARTKVLRATRLLIQADSRLLRIIKLSHSIDRWTSSILLVMKHSGIIAHHHPRMKSRQEVCQGWIERVLLRLQDGRDRGSNNASLAQV